MATWEPLPELPEWRSTVRVDEDPALAAELERRLPPEGGGRTVSVTELLAPRIAYWKKVRPVPFSPERERSLAQGRLVHRHLAAVLAEGGAAEVRVRRGGISGRIDVLSDVPIEVKTGSGPEVAVEALGRDRPDFVEQLAMYCALAGGPAGRLVTCRVDGDVIRRVRSVDLRFRDPREIGRSMEERAAALRSALEAGTPAGLPRCRWHGRGCEFQAAGVCDCTGGEPLPSTAVLDAVAASVPRPDLDAQWEDRIRDRVGPDAPPVVDRFRDLLYPRRAYFDRAGTATAVTVPEGRGLRPDLYARLVDAIESGPLGEVARIPPLVEEPEEDVIGFRGTPYLVRSSRARGPIPPHELLARFPQYAVELGVRCAVTGTREGRLVWGFERAETGRDRLRVMAFRFDPVTPFSRMFRGRVAALRSAIAERAPERLAPCPEWMYADCPYRPGCACVGSPTRTQR